MQLFFSQLLAAMWLAAWACPRTWWESWRTECVFRGNGLAEVASSLHSLRFMQKHSHWMYPLWGKWNCYQTKLRRLDRFRSPGILISETSSPVICSQPLSGGKPSTLCFASVTSEHPLGTQEVSKKEERRDKELCLLQENIPAVPPLA